MTVRSWAAPLPTGLQVRPQGPREKSRRRRDHQEDWEALWGTLAIISPCHAFNCPTRAALLRTHACMDADWCSQSDAHARFTSRQRRRHRGPLAFPEFPSLAFPFPPLFSDYFILFPRSLHGAIPFMFRVVFRNCGAVCPNWSCFRSGPDSWPTSWSLPNRPSAQTATRTTALTTALITTPTTTQVRAGFVADQLVLAELKHEARSAQSSKDGTLEAHSLTHSLAHAHARTHARTHTHTHARIHTRSASSSKDGTLEAHCVLQRRAEILYRRTLGRHSYAPRSLFQSGWWCSKLDTSCPFIFWCGVRAPC